MWILCWCKSWKGMMINEFLCAAYLYVNIMTMQPFPLPYHPISTSSEHQKSMNSKRKMK